MMTNFKTSKELLPVIFLFIILTSCEKTDYESSSEVKDIDGNTYPVISIGEQLWMVENLRTTRYNDGTEIPNVSDNKEWAQLNAPAYCWYKNDETNKSEYGALYKWYTVVDTCEVCPEGWHVPSDEEWTELEVYLQNNGFNYDGSFDSDNDRHTNNKIGKALTTATGWLFTDREGAIGNSDYPEYQNLSGFNAVPSGYRDSGGSFWCLTTIGHYCSTTVCDSTSVWYRRLSFKANKTTRDFHSKMDGFAIRCMKYKDPN